MADSVQQNKGPESSPSSPPLAEKVNAHEAKSHDINDPSVAREAVSALDTADIASEAGEAINARVSESASNLSDSKSGSMARSSAPIDPDQIRSQLLKDLPSEKQMKIKIEQEIKKEIKYLHKKAIKMLRNPSNVSFFEMANILRKIRELRGILWDLAKASLEALKTLWLRFVHGVL